MSLLEFGALGEIIGGIAVLITLVYLSVQLRQANQTTHRQMYAHAASDVSNFWFKLAEQPELYAAFTHMLTQHDELSEDARDQGYLILDAYLSLMEAFFLHNIEYGETLSQERWRRVLTRMLNTPGGRAYWARRKFAFPDTFASYVDSVLV